jgi:bifunctional ADP-heptose synthase (sugar kinase/adenylyltransferase)
LAGEVAACNAVIISDYAKGVCTPQLCQAVIAAARTAGVAVVVDPAKGGDWTKYNGATVLKPNAVQWRDWLARGGAASVLAEHLVVTRGEQGLILDGRLIPAELVKAVDVTGCGDTLAATLAVGLGAGVELETACQLANLAAAEQARQRSVRPVQLAIPLQLSWSPGPSQNCSAKERPGSLAGG